MLLSYLNKDILKYVLNLYLDWDSDIPKMKNLINVYNKVGFSFDLKPHVYAYINSCSNYVSININVCIDNTIVKVEQYTRNNIYTKEWNKTYFIDNLLQRKVNVDSYMNGNMVCISIVFPTNVYCCTTYLN